MNHKQRNALIALVCHLVIWAILAFSGIVIYLSGKMSTVYIVGCAGCLIWTSFLWFMPFIKAIRTRSKYPTDERDLMITQKSVLIGFISIWLYFIAVSIILWFVVGADGAVPIGVFPALLYVGMGIFSVVTNIAAWFLYRTDNHLAEGDDA